MICLCDKSKQDKLSTKENYYESPQQCMDSTGCFIDSRFFSGCCTTRNVRHEQISTVASADGSPITYGVSGQGDITLVFIHCWTCNHEFWRPQIEYFSKNYKVLWLDLAGHGLSGSHRQEYTIAAFGGDVAAVVKKLNGKNVVLVGHSVGGPVASEAAKLLGDDVIGIVGVGTFYTPFEYPTDEAKTREFLKPFESDYKSASEQLVRSMFTQSATIGNLPTRILAGVILI